MSVAAGDAEAVQPPTFPAIHRDSFRGRPSRALCLTRQAARRRRLAPWPLAVAVVVVVVVVVAAEAAVVVAEALVRAASARLRP
jgi:hypothetical protein